MQISKLTVAETKNTHAFKIIKTLTKLNDQEVLKAMADVSTYFALSANAEQLNEELCFFGFINFCLFYTTCVNGSLPKKKLKNMLVKSLETQAFQVINRIDNQSLSEH